MERIRKVEQNFPDTLEKYDINVIIGPSDSWFSQYSAATGQSSCYFSYLSSYWPVLADECFLGYQYPLCSLPLGYVAYNGRPIGLTAIAKSKVTLLTLMSAVLLKQFSLDNPNLLFLSMKMDETLPMMTGLLRAEQDGRGRSIRRFLDAMPCIRISFH